jgi:ABC-type polysaccharide/polyol phosphate export permease
MDLASRRFTWLYAASLIKLKYRYTSLGFFWNLLEPGLYLGLLSVLFSVVNRMRLSDYAVFLFSALVPWRYFEKVVHSCMDAIVQGDWLLKKLPVSAFALPLARWIVASVEFLFSFVALFVVLAFLKERWTVHCLVLPLSAMVWSVLAFGLGLLAATLFTFFRDIRPIVQMGMMFAFFSAPILFKPDLFQAGSLQARWLVWHPMTYLAALFQKPIYGAAWPEPRDWVISVFAALSALAVGALVVRVNRARFYFYI